MVPFVILSIVLFTIVALAIAPPTFISDLFDGESKRRKKQKDWVEED
jgi:hypothetical protein